MLRKEDLWSAIRTKCLHCCDNYAKTVTLCEDRECSLWYYRMGRPPTRQEILLEDLN